MKAQNLLLAAALFAAKDDHPTYRSPGRRQGRPSGISKAERRKRTRQKKSAKRARRANR